MIQGVDLGYNLKRYGQWCLITGASSGIGLQFAHAVAQEGLNLILVARRKERLEALASELEARHKIETRIIVQDLSLPDSTQRVSSLCAGIEVDMMVLNAGFGFYGRFVDISEDELARMIALNCSSVALLARRFLPPMIERRRGA
ncbi:MAG: hypothetical protein DRG82_16975, partial [Deltaproteobacteria bacterium]